MMRKFKHRTLGWIAEGCFYDKDDTLFAVSEEDNDTTVRAIPKKLIENSRDREEVIEKDWIELCVEWIGALEDIEYPCISENPTRWKNKETIREIIEKHAPKQVKFKRHDIQKWYNNYPSIDGTRMLIDFLQDNNLLEEPCQHESNWEVYTSNPPQYKCEKCWAFY